ncbi:hypothetical protein PoB_007390000 [Plakobranchus ocellatus]|uniref:Uncharacterized protein n=1 Tax=Plakobranchus ocellatus TaxID=259542 RepID=A0AAV4DTC2_9GAST|nr:hypothetical protein PoB_007390000 [Plakobranchus ocellatus]
MKKKKKCDSPGVALTDLDLDIIGLDTLPLGLRLRRVKTITQEQRWDVTVLYVLDDNARAKSDVTVLNLLDHKARAKMEYDSAYVLDDNARAKMGCDSA